MSAANAYDVVVIGGGANGLVAATRLATRGRRVLLLERAETLGGQGALVEFAPGFRAAPLGFDPGWAPPAVASLVGLGAADLDNADAPLSVFTEAGRFLTLPRDPARAAAAIREHSPSDAAKWPAFVERVHRLAGFLGELYQTPSPDVGLTSLGDLPALARLGLKYRGLGREGMIEFLRTLPLSAWEWADDWFECAPLKAAIATGGIQDYRQGPRSGGTAYVLLHYLVGAPKGALRGRAAWRHGPEAFTTAAEAAARRAGVTIRTGAAATVARIDVHEHAVTGVTLANGESITAKAVLSTADPSRVFLEWVDPVWLDPEFLHAVSNIRYRGCTAVVLFALDALPEASGLGHEALGGLVSMTPSVVALEKAADAAKFGEISAQPHVEWTVPTARTPGLAPAGKHVVAARVQYAPYALKAGAWDDARRDAIAESATRVLEAAIPGFRAHVLHRVALTPVDLEARFGLREGAATQGELGLDQILFMRPVAGWGRHATPIRGLYAGGAGTHPGPGVLGGAGWLAANRLLEDR